MQLSKRVCTIAILALFAVGIAFGYFCGERRVAEAGLFDMLTPEMVEFYETEIAKEKVLSSKSDRTVRAIAARYGIDEQKARCVILLYDFAKRTGGGVDFPEIAKMSEYKMFALAKQRSDVFVAKLTDEEKERLKQKASALIGIRL